jgi:predicted nucleic acid-binding protein
MSRVVLVDTGPLVAFLNRRDGWHQWALDRLGEVEPPLDTCEAVLSEACYLLRATPAGPAAVMELVTRGLVRLAFGLGREAEAVRRLLHRYRTVPMSLADACLVRMSELNAGCQLLTLDGDFRIYRRNGRQVIPLICPADAPARR